VIGTSPAEPRADLDRRRSWRWPTIDQVWAFAAVALPVLAALRATIVTNDLAYQIRAGDLMLSTHHVLRADPFTFTAFGRPWLDQQWGAQIVFALVYRAGGWAGLAIFRAVLVGVTATCVWLACRASGAGSKRAAWLGLAGFLVWAGGAALRPQMLGVALFAIAVWVVSERRRHPAWLWAVPVITVVWGNVHGSFFLAPLLVGLAWLQDRHDRAPGSRRTLVITAVSLVATAVGPFGVRVWEYAVSISTNPVIARAISEWQPPTIRDATGALFFMSLGAVVAFLAWRGTPWPTLVILAVFAAIALEAGRGVFWWGIVVPPVVAGLLPPVPASSEARTWANGAIAAVVVMLGIVSLPTWQGGTPTSPSPKVVANAPVELTAELRRILRPGERYFDPVPWASWFELELPRNPVFLDPRIEVFPRSVLDQHVDVSLGRQGWQLILDRWGIDVVVADRGEEGELIPIISREPGWREVYADGRGVIYVRLAGGSD
jgi:hypothetical protein